MREILFRGKSIQNDGWVEGLPMYNSDCQSIDKIEVAMETGGIGVRILPETVGQFTGLLDKNGKKIFEGDILTSSSEKKMLVIWRNDLSSFALSADGWMYDHYFGEAVDAGNCEIIGNIHDNTELI